MHFWSRTPGPLLYAHRGANTELPENSLKAFRRAVELGADVLELDLHPTRDGIFTVSHDPNAERTCGVSRVLGSCAWSEVSTWDAGWGFTDAQGARPYAGLGMRLARFDEVLDEFPDIAFNVDVKSASPNELRSLLDLIHQRRVEERVLLTSFSWRSIQRMRRAGYRGPLGLSQLDVAQLFFAPGSLTRLVPFSGIRAQIPTRFGRIDLTTPRFIEKCHRLGLRVDYWVINTPEEARSLLERGADGVITDDVRAVAAAFRTSPQTAAWRERHA